MRLLQYTTRYFLTLIIALLILLCAALYFSVRRTVYRDIDEYLFSRHQEILGAIAKHPEMVNEKSVYHKDFSIKPITYGVYNRFIRRHQRRHHGLKFKDTNKFDEIEKENEPFRKIESVFEQQGSFYKLTVTTSLLSSEELLFTILTNLILFAGLLVLLTVALNRMLMQRAWKPFYTNMRKIKLYRLDKEVEMDLEDSRITEFREFKESVEELVRNNVKAYKNQKQFIENASHEMQTPLGVMQNKIDLLMETASLNDQQAQLAEDLAAQIGRLSRLNRTLLLLSKLENNQFVENELIDIRGVIRGCCEDFSELIEFKSLRLEVEMDSPLTVTMHPDLARMLFANLIKNAINHNISPGFIRIRTEDDRVIIANSGKELLTSPETLFERFQKKSDNPQSNGLGLAIVKKITNLYNFRIVYEYRDNVHVFSVIF